MQTLTLDLVNQLEDREHQPKVWEKIAGLSNPSQPNPLHAYVKELIQVPQEPVALLMLKIIEAVCSAKAESFSIARQKLADLLSQNPDSPVIRGAIDYLIQLDHSGAGEIANEEYQLKIFVLSESDRYCYDEIYGETNSYRREFLIPLMYRGTVVDIGAHKGFFSLLAGCVANRVLSFEPEPENYHYLQQNIKLNHMGHVFPIQKAVSNTEENRIFTVSDITAVRHTLVGSDFSGEGKKIEVACTTLPAILSDQKLRVERINLLKVDIEGGEYDLFLNCDRSIFDKIDAIIIEFHEIKNIPHRMKSLMNLFESVGYVGKIYNEVAHEAFHVWMGLFVKPWVKVKSDLSFVG